MFSYPRSTFNDQFERTVYFDQKKKLEFFVTILNFKK